MSRGESVIARGRPISDALKRRSRGWPARHGEFLRAPAAEELFVNGRAAGSAIVRAWSKAELGVQALSIRSVSAAS